MLKNCLKSTVRCQVSILTCDFKCGRPLALADPGIYFGGPNQDPQSKVEGEARIKGAKRPSIEGEARVEGAKRPRIEGEAQTEGEARKKAGGGVWGGARWAPPQKIFEKSNLKPFILVHIWSNYLKWLTKWFSCPHSWKIMSNSLMWRYYQILLEYETC